MTNTNRSIGAEFQWKGSPGLQAGENVTPWYPCVPCARGILQCGIHEVEAVEPDWNDAHYAAEFERAAEILRDGGVEVRFMAGEAPRPSWGVPKP